jgi:hypothetical protein
MDLATRRISVAGGARLLGRYLAADLAAIVLERV